MMQSFLQNEIMSPSEGSTEIPEPPVDQPFSVPIFQVSTAITSGQCVKLLLKVSVLTNCVLVY